MRVFCYKSSEKYVDFTCRIIKNDDDSSISWQCRPAASELPNGPPNGQAIPGIHGPLLAVPACGCFSRLGTGEPSPGLTAGNAAT